MRTRLVATLFAVPLLSSLQAFGWGGPHRTITEAALSVLPDWQQQALGPEVRPLGSLYCFIPDLVYTRKDLAPFAMVDSRPGVVYLVNLHLPAGPTKNLEILRYFVGRAVAAVQAEVIGDAARYAGTLAHVLEDWTCPAHSVPNDNMFTLFKQFLPPPEPHRFTLLHGPMEGGSFPVDIGGYRPVLLGTTSDEAAFNLLRRAQEGTVYARGQVIPIIQALYAGDTKASNAARQRAALVGARLVADALYTVMCLGLGEVDPREAAQLRAADLSAFAPNEAASLYLPQASFFSKPYWGHALRGAILDGKGEPAPLRLNVPDGDSTVARTLETGIGTGTRSVLSYTIPPGVYTRFTAWAGLHADFGASGHVRFDVTGNGRSLVRLGSVKGNTTAARVDVPIEGITELRLTVASAGGDGSGNFVVWGDPRLVK